MKATFAATTLFALALAAPVSKRAGCTFSPFEVANLQHGHDVNTGKIKVGAIIIESGIVFDGSKCSPAWAVGGAITDNTPTVYTGNAKPLSPEQLANLLGPLASSNITSLLGSLGGAAGGKGGAAGYGDLSGLLGKLGGV